MKILTLLGTRPEIIRLSVIIKKLNHILGKNHIVVYSNQNFDYQLSKVFFQELDMFSPSYYFGDLEAKSVGEFLSKGMEKFENVLNQENPDKILILGDTNTGLLAMLAAKRGISVYHMEAGNRCFDSRVPEETNRRIIDSFSKVNLPYTENSKQNLLAEGYHKNFVFKIGNPIYEVLNEYQDGVRDSMIIEKLKLRYNDYVLVTAHRSENVDNNENLIELYNFLNEIAKDRKVVFSVHPRTKSKLNHLDLKFDENVILSEPFGFFDFVKLEKHAFCVVTDSGTVQEETQIFKVPSITIRNTTERQETIENGSTILTGMDYKKMLEAYNTLRYMNTNWSDIEDYKVENVSDRVIKILFSR
jgi:UDP-N-acetylglucosamine 2-epimerase (non-hydrolysing)